VLLKILILAVFVAVAGCDSNESQSESPENNTQDTIPSELGGLVATIRALDSTMLSSQPIRLEHTLKNTSAKSIVVYDLENSVFFLFDPTWGCMGCGPTSERPSMTLSPGQSVSRWVELTRGKPTRDWPISVIVRSEGTGVSYICNTKPVPRTFSFRVGYDGKVLTSVIGEVGEPVLATPWIKIKVQ
jgi:hypothetical protein